MVGPSLSRTKVRENFSLADFHTMCKGLLFLTLNQGVDFRLWILLSSTWSNLRSRDTGANILSLPDHSCFLNTIFACAASAWTWDCDSQSEIEDTNLNMARNMARIIICSLQRRPSWVFSCENNGLSQFQLFLWLLCKLQRLKRRCPADV
jgi:hypothetical protein